MNDNNKNSNPQKELDKLIASLELEQKTPTLLLHSCCAPCSSYVIEYLSNHFSITVFFYNPNIYPAEEYTRRLKEQQRFISELQTKHPVTFIAGDFENNAFYTAVKGKEEEKEGGSRCKACFELRLNKTAQKAKEINTNYFATTLTISPLKNALLINKIGALAAQKYGTQYLPTDFKKKNGFKRSIELSKTYNLYRQNYCGCKYSGLEVIRQQETGKV
ncbi:hypothetical protein AGMMS50284_1890 [Clostridia bacterium]|nr:hypothetical protein AGMMS50284_1890 [Clostridia bacterium]